LSTRWGGILSSLVTFCKVYARLAVNRLRSLRIARGQGRSNEIGTAADPLIGVNPAASSSPVVSRVTSRTLANVQNYFDTCIRKA
jgi:hypothetical protein